MQSLKTIAIAMLWSGVCGGVLAQDTVRVQDYPGPGNRMLRVAIANGYCDKRGIKCEAKTIPAAPLAVQTMLAGDLGIAMAPPEVVIRAVNKGADLRIIGNGACNPVFS